jgi:DNA-binding CsgD family transcriptional regulator
VTSGSALTGRLYDESMVLPEWSDPDKREAALERVAWRIERAGPLTGRELAVVFLASHGVMRRRAAEMLNIAPGTAAHYAKGAQAKLGASNQAHTVATALRLGLIS